MSPLPASFPSPFELPFNRTAMADSFTLETPDRDPGDDGVWLLLRGNELLACETPGGLVLPEGALPDGISTGTPLFIGHWQGRPCRLLAVDRDQALPEGIVAESLLSGDPRLSIELLSLGGLGGQILHWGRTGERCSICGGSTEWLSGEWGRRCRECGYSHFPHIHPCAIVIVRRPGEVLLTRKPGWPAGRYSLVAGFVDFGECLEETVVREVREETGVTVGNVRYVGSQAWPFPSQLMAGFTADYISGDVQVEEKELEDVRWFSVDELPNLPPRRSIARYLIDHFLRGETPE
ncbi:MAG TPA: NAD(+) diphosphatase [Desulfuromonadales bacterium]|nr:NAD(+) diphosphatase [Desulfuromonadales bacterium]